MVRIPNPFGLTPGARRLKYSEACFADVIPLSRTDPTDIPIPFNRYLSRFGYEASVRFQGRWSPSLRLSSHFQLLFDTGGTFAPEVSLECTNYRKRQHNTYRQFYESFDFIKLAQAFLTGQGHLVSQMAGMFSLTEEWLFGDRDMALAWFNQLDYESRNGYETKQMIHDYPINYEQPRWDDEVTDILDKYARSTPGDNDAELDRNQALYSLDKEAARSSTLDRIRDENEDNLSRLLQTLEIQPANQEHAHYIERCKLNLLALEPPTAVQYLRSQPLSERTDDLPRNPGPALYPDADWYANTPSSWLQVLNNPRDRLLGVDIGQLRRDIRSRLLDDDAEEEDDPNWPNNFVVGQPLELWQQSLAAEGRRNYENRFENWENESDHEDYLDQAIYTVAMILARRI